MIKIQDSISGGDGGEYHQWGCKEVSKVLIIFYFLTISNFKFYIHSFYAFICIINFSIKRGNSISIAI